MARQKWNSDEICKFLDIYEQFDILWNSRLPDYVNKHKREIALEKLLHVIAQSGLGHFNVEQLRKKIKSIRTVYRMELLKILKSQNNYKPKLVWFKRANNFLRSVMTDDATLPVNSVSVSDPLHVEATVKEESNDITVADDDDDELMDLQETETCSLPAIASTSVNKSTEDEFSVFARHVAMQLRMLPLVKALHLETEIQKLIATERISCLSNIKIDDGVKFVDEK